MMMMPCGPRSRPLVLPRTLCSRRWQRWWRQPVCSSCSSSSSSSFSSSGTITNAASGTARAVPTERKATTLSSLSLSSSSLQKRIVSFKHHATTATTMRTTLPYFRVSLNIHVQQQQQQQQQQIRCMSNRKQKREKKKKKLKRKGHKTKPQNTVVDKDDDDDDDDDDDEGYLCGQEDYDEGYNYSYDEEEEDEDEQINDERGGAIIFEALWKDGHGLFVSNLIAGTHFTMSDVVHSMKLSVPPNIDRETGSVKYNWKPQQVEREQMARELARQEEEEKEEKRKQQQQQQQLQQQK